MMRKRSVHLHAARGATLRLASAFVIAACSGSIGDQPSADSNSILSGGGAHRGPLAGALGANGEPIGDTSSTNVTPNRDPGRVTLHRLNRAEFNNTVRDLLGTSLRPADDFPADDYGYGFDNIADVLSTSPSMLRLYDAATETLAEEAISTKKSRFIACDPSAATGGTTCVRTTLSDFATKAYRRPVSSEEVDGLVAFYRQAIDAGDTSDAGLKLAMRATLLSPHFLFRVELDPDPISAAPHPLGDFELASRLSYFLWSSMPDDALLAKATAGKLQDPSDVASETTRMLADPKAQAFIDNFVGQWLYTRWIKDLQPDPSIFPTVDDALRTSMKREIELFVGEFLHGSEPITEMLTADFSFIDARLATHYGMGAVAGLGAGPSDFTKTKLDTAKRGGLLRQAGILSATSLPARTSAVKRGKWVLGQMLCSAPPPPPPNIPPLPMDSATTGTVRTLRQRMEAHRRDPVCAGCHMVMDPIGFGLENYDAIGAFRTDDQGQAIDPSGNLPDGTTFRGAQDLSVLLSKDPRFEGCVASKLFTYALGRGVEPADDPYLKDISGTARKNGNRLADVIVAIVGSEPFRTRRGQASSTGGMP